MKKKLTRFICVFMIGLTLMAGNGEIANAKPITFGNSKSGASTNEVLEIRYDGAAWNYRGSGYKSTSFKYTRNGKLLLYVKASSGKKTGTVWDNPVPGKARTTKFSWSREK